MPEFLYPGVYLEEGVPPEPIEGVPTSIERTRLQTLAEELRRAVRVHTPEWTGTNESDPGISTSRSVNPLSVTMRDRFGRLAGTVFVATLLSSAPALPQSVSVGVAALPLRYVNPTQVLTIVDTWAPAAFDGQLTKASFEWSASPCPAAVKIKIFRPSASLFLLDFQLPESFSFVAERGPFDVTAPLRNDDLIRYAYQEVALNPPLDVQAGDVIAITNLTTCGGPVLQRAVSNFFSPPRGSGSFSLAGDVTFPVPNPRVFNPWVAVGATGNSSEIGLLGGRFVASLIATDPRSGRTAKGVPNLLNNSVGYFSLPDFTGDPRFPEVMVKMVDATGVPSLGGTFWFFHAPLTDVPYTITVKDRFSGKVRIYANVPGGPGELCGGGDTSAFPP